MALEDAAKLDLERLEALKDELRSQLSLVREPVCRTILLLRYVECMTIDELADALCYSRRQIYRLLADGRALVTVPEQYRDRAG